MNDIAKYKSKQVVLLHTHLFASDDLQQKIGQSAIVISVRNDDLCLLFSDGSSYFVKEHQVRLIDG